MSVNWLQGPLPLRTVCSRLRAAVEEREAFFQLTPAAADALELPERPCRHDQAATFAERLATRMGKLLNNAFDPRNFGVWCDWRAAMANAGPRIMNVPEAEITAAFGIDGAKLCRRRPYRWEDPAGFFTAAAEVLDRIALYPAPPPFSSARTRDQGWVFGMNAVLSITDLVNGRREQREFQPAGRLALTLADGGTAYCYPGTVRRWERDRVECAASDWSIYYDAEAAPESGGDDNTSGQRIALTGEFRMRLRTGMWCTGDATTTYRTQELAVRPGGVCDAPDFSCWHAEFTAAPEADADRREVSLDFRCSEILIRPENYPPLPYQYLT